MLELLDHLYEGALDPPAWQGFLAALNSQLQADTCCILLRDHSQPKPEEFWIHGGTEAVINRYADLMYASDPFVGLPEQRAVLLEEHLDVTRWQQSDFYRICVAPGGLKFFIGIDQRLSETTTICLRAAKFVGAMNFTASDKALLEALIGHIARSYRLFMRVQLGTETALATTALFQDALRSLSVGVVVIDKRMQVQTLNKSAEVIIARHEELQLTQGRLLIQAQPLSQQVRKALTHLNSDSPTDELPVWVLNNAKADPELIVSLRLNPAVAEGFCLYLIPMAMDEENGAQFLKSLFALTPAESQLCMKLVNGLSLNQAAQDAEITKNTAKAHLRAIFSKLNVGSQAQLVSVLSRCLSKALHYSETDA